METTADFEISETMESVLELPEKQRNAVYLFYYEGYTAAEIGRMYYVSESTVHSWLHKGRKKIKDNAQIRQKKLSVKQTDNGKTESEVRLNDRQDYNNGS